MELPPGEVALLSSLRSDLPALRARVRLLRTAGWTLDAIGAPLGAPRSTVRSWALHPDASPLSLPPPPSPPPRLLPHPVRALAPDVPADDATRIRTLAPLARKVRGGTPPDSPARRASTQLALLLAYHAHERHVPVSTLARIAGVSSRAMKVRLRQAAP